VGFHPIEIALAATLFPSANRSGRTPERIGSTISPLCHTGDSFRVGKKSNDPV